MASDADSDNDNEMGIDSDDSDVEEEEENRRLQQEQQQRSTRSFFPGRRGGEGEQVGGELKRPSSTATSGSPLVCLVNLAGDSAAGAAVGSLFGYASGLIKKKGVRGSFADAGTSAKTFAVLAGVHGLVVCFLKNLRKKDDAINAGIAGCCTGLALSFPGAPQVLLQSCLTFGAFSSIIEGLNKKQPALAHVSSIDNVNTKGMQDDVLPPFTLPLPHDLLEGFSSFCKSLPNFKRAS